MKRVILQGGIIITLAFGLVAFPQVASSYDFQEEIKRRIDYSSELQSLGTDIFGDKADWYTGSVTFRHMDLDIPGNSRLPVQIVRTASTKALESAGELLGNWQLEVPYMSGLYAASTPWIANRCTATNWSAPEVPSDPDPFDPAASTTFSPHEYWRGVSVNIPGFPRRTMLRKAAEYSLTPSDGLNYPYITLDHVQITCLSSLKSGQTGEGFLATAPDGTRYYFDWLVTRNHGWVTKPNINATATGSDPLAFGVYRQETRIYASKAVDRFGNTVDYTYSGDQLTKIKSSDGREININYNANGLIGTITAHGSTWTYSYTLIGARYSLTKVTLPDSSFWELPLSVGLSVRYGTGGGGYDPSCEPSGKPIISGQENLIFKHPSGASGSFTFDPVVHYRENVPTMNCGYPPYYDGSSPVTIVRGFRDYGLTTKSISGPLLATDTWSVTYQGSNLGQGSKSVLVTNPDSSSTKYTLGNTYAGNEGKLLKEEIFSSTGSVLRTTTHTWSISPSASPYAYIMGWTGIGGYDDHQLVTQIPELTREINQESVTYTRNTPQQQFNGFAKPLKVERYSTLGSSKSESISYYHDFSKWAINLPGVITDLGTGVIEQENDYYAVSALPSQKRKFGLVEGAFVWAADGTLSTFADGLNRTSSYSSWKRGSPRLIQLPNATTYSIAVSDLGRVESVTDENGGTTGYSYDDVGRISGIVYPTPDSVAWTSPIIDYAPITSGVPAYGIPVGAWRRQEEKGRFRSRTYYDARWRPILVEEYDSISGKYEFTRKSYDYDGRVIFSSNRSSSSSATDGVVTTYDSLGRMTKRATPNGTILELVQYLPNGKFRTTDADGKITTITYKGYDEPSYNLATLIESPENQITAIGRDSFGKITSVTQSGPWSGSMLSATRSFIYDAHQRPCRRVDPESGSTVWGYDAASQLSWEAKGQSGSGCLSSAPIGSTYFEYDLIGRKIKDDYAGTTEDVTYAYDNVGNLTSISNSTAVWSYGYNKRNQLESEQVSIDGLNFGLDYTYNPLGHLLIAGSPSGYNLYNPNAWGRPTQIGSWVSNIEHHPNGKPASYTLSNGYTFSQLLDNRQRIIEQDLKDGAYSLQNLKYQYSTASDLLLINGGADSMSAQYDGLHRIIETEGLWGGYIYQYDPLNNIRTRENYQAGTGISYNYNSATNRLTSISGEQARSYSYNDKGEIVADGSKSLALNSLGQIKEIAGVATYLYDGHGKRIKTLKSGGAVEYDFYNKNGDLVFTKSGTSNNGYIYLAGKPLIKTQNGMNAIFLHSDLLGSPRMATYDTGGIAWQEHFDPYGNKLNSVVEKIGYSGHAFDPESGLTYMQARFYDPLVGRFLSTDPVHFKDNNPFTFNRYSYANNNPYKFVDPDGKFAFLGMFVGATIEAGTQLYFDGAITDYNAVATAGLMGAVTGGVGTAVAKQVMTGAMSVGRAVLATAAVGGAATGAGSASVDASNGKPFDPGKTAIAAILGAAGSGAGARVGLTFASSLERMASSGGILGGMSTATRGVFTQGGPDIAVPTTAGQTLAGWAADAAANVGQRQEAQSVIFEYSIVFGRLDHRD